MLFCFFSIGLISLIGQIGRICFEGGNLWGDGAEVDGEVTGYLFIGLVTHMTAEVTAFDGPAFGGESSIDKQRISGKLQIVGSVGDGLTQNLGDGRAGPLDGEAELLKSLGGGKSNNRLGHEIDLSG